MNSHRPDWLMETDEPGLPGVDIPTHVSTYEHQQARRCAGHISVHQNGTPSWSGQVCAVASSGHFGSQHSTLLLVTSKHVVTWEDDDNEEPIYEISCDGKYRLRKKYQVKIYMPVMNVCWDSTNGAVGFGFEFFADEVSENDIAFIAIDLPNEQLPYPTILPDPNNEFTGAQNLAHFFGYVFRSIDDDDDANQDDNVFLFEDGQRLVQHEIDFEGAPLQDQGILTVPEHTQHGDSGGMLYCYAPNDESKLIPACIITRRQETDSDSHHVFNLNVAGALQGLWRSTLRCIVARNEARTNNHRERLAHVCL